MAVTKTLPCVIGIDPGLRNTGFGIISFSKNRFSCFEYGTIVTPQELTQGERLLIIFDTVSALIKKYKPSEAGIETLYFAKNVSSAMGVSEARGVILLSLAQGGVRVSEYAPNTIKKAVTGIATAEKKQVQTAVKLILGLRTLPETDHAADALAAAITKINLGDVGEANSNV